MVDTESPQNHLPGVCSAVKMLKGKGEGISVNRWDRGSDSSCALSLDAIVFTQFVHDITEGEAKEEIGHL